MQKCAVPFRYQNCLVAPITFLTPSHTKDVQANIVCITYQLLTIKQDSIFYIILIKA